MNRYPLNSRVIGAGSQSSLSYVAAVQNFVLQVAATAIAIRGMRVNQTLTLDQAARAVVTRLFAAAHELRLNVALTTKTYYMTYAAAAQQMILSTTATARQRIKRYVQASQALSLQASFTIHQWIKTYASALQNFALSTGAKYGRFMFVRGEQTLAMMGSLRTRITRFIKVAGTLVLTGSIQIRTALRSRISQAMTLLTSIIASDLTSTPANIERTAEVSNTSRLVVVPGESYESGV